MVNLDIDVSFAITSVGKAPILASVGKASFEPSDRLVHPAEDVIVLLLLEI